MSYQLQFKQYQYSFRHPLKTHYGIWQKREGIILCLSDRTGRVGWGEIAPIPWFGSETLEAALAFCQQLEGQVSDRDIAKIPDTLPACQFAFESALTQLNSEAKVHSEKDTLNYSYLLPAGEGALEAWQVGWQRGRRTFKWKIGVNSIAEEIKLFDRLNQSLPKQALLRLDANGGLNINEAKEWLRVVDGMSRVEFIEQPLATQEFEAMLELGNRFTTALALDESVANLKQLQDCYDRGWRGIFVVKPAIAGSPQRLRYFCQQYQIDAVFSSVFETEIGRKAALRLAAELSSPDRAVGFGVENYQFLSLSPNP